MRATPSKFLDPLPAVTLGKRTVLVDTEKPVAAVIDEGQIQFVTWGSAPLPALGATPQIVSAPSGLWIVYSEEDVPGSTGLPQSTAVHIARDLSVAAVSMGELSPVGADGEGLWCSREPLPEFEVSDDYEPFDLDQIDIEPDAPIEDLEDLRSDSVPSFRPSYVQANDDDTASFGWGFGFGSVSGMDADEPELPAPVAPVATGPVTLQRFRIDGGIDLLRVDRLVSRVEMVNDKLRLIYHPTGPVVTLADDRRSSTITYPTEFIDLDASEGLPPNVVVGDFVSTPLDAYADESTDESDGSVPPIDISAVPDAVWDLPAEVPDGMQAHIDAAVEQLTALGDPQTVWHSGDERWHRVRSDYRDVTVSVHGTWPATEVVAEFRYLPEGDRRFRFPVPVFNSAGRPNVPRYLTVYLEEDLATTDYDGAQLTEDGFVEV